MVPGIFPFGDLHDGTSIEEIRLSSDGMNATIITWGAVIRDLKVSIGSVRDRRVVLGLNNIEDYLLHSPHFGAVAGRCANRIASGQFDLDGQTVQLTKNQNNTHHLHGGLSGFGKRVWTVVDHSDAHVTLQIIALDGEEGYPGELTAQCTYKIETIDDQVRLVVELTATTTAPTLVNMAQHSYFNLDESPDISGHQLQIRADAYLPTNDLFIPTGEIKSVEETSFDFRESRPINASADLAATTYDNNFVISESKTNRDIKMATLTGERGLSMDISSTEPGLQFYDGSRVNVPVDGIDGRPYGSFAGICLEPQIWPDSPNHANFPSAVLRPDETYHQITSYGFYESRMQG